jgi:hypothetical protein
MKGTLAEFYEFRDGQNVTRFSGWPIRETTVPLPQQQQYDLGYSCSINEKVFRVDGGEIQQDNGQEAGIRVKAWGVCVAEYRSDGKFDTRPVEFRKEIEVHVKCFPDLMALVKWSPSLGIRILATFCIRVMNRIINSIRR